MRVCDIYMYVCMYMYTLTHAHNNKKTCTHQSCLRKPSEYFLLVYCVCPKLVTDDVDNLVVDPVVVSANVCMHVRMYVCVRTCTKDVDNLVVDPVVVSAYVCMHACMYVCRNACMCLCMYG